TAYTTGKINESQRTLFGDLIIESEGDPSFTPVDAAELAASIRSQGIQRVEGRLLIQGPFRFQYRSLEFSYSKMRSALGLSFPKVAQEATDSTAESATERIVLGVHE